MGGKFTDEEINKRLTTDPRTAAVDVGFNLMGNKFGGQVDSDLLDGKGGNMIFSSFV